MSERHPEGSRWVRLVRWLGFDRNPLRRPADRAESLLRLLVVVLLVAGVPVATIAAGRTADHLVLRQAQAQRSERHLVQAVLIKRATADSNDHPYSNVPVAWVAARWTALDGSAHHGQVLAQAGARPGSTVPVWIDRSGAVTDPPLTHAKICVDVSIAVMAAAELLPILLLGLLSLGRHLLDIRRWKAWDSEWGAIGPQWSRHRA